MSAAGTPERFSAPKGSYDLLPPQSRAHLAVRETFARTAQLAGYAYVETPAFEDTAVFERGVGESTDVVTKEMYTFADKGGRSLTLRPEGTAGVLRAVLQGGMEHGQKPVKVWYSGAYFRYERPQAGRYRHFWQVGVEALGSDDPALDAEVIAMAVDSFALLGLTQFRVLYNALGCARCRPDYRRALVAFLEGLDLDEETRRRIRVNPLRVLDDKRPEVAAQTATAPVTRDYLCEQCREHDLAVRAHLRDLEVAITEAPRLVRGLDYYTKTTFEIQHDLLGAQSAIGGGGRYDGLSQVLGGPPMSGIGYGLGVDRTVLAATAEGLTPGGDGSVRCEVFLVPLGGAGSDVRRRALRLLRELRHVGLAADMSFGSRGLKGAMKAADRSGARLGVIIGERDLAEGAAGLKDLATGEQEQVPLDALVETVAGRLTEVAGKGSSA